MSTEKQGSMRKIILILCFIVMMTSVFVGGARIHQRHKINRAKSVPHQTKEANVGIVENSRWRKKRPTLPVIVRIVKKHDRKIERMLRDESFMDVPQRRGHRHRHRGGRRRRGVIAGAVLNFYDFPMRYFISKPTIISRVFKAGGSTYVETLLVKGSNGVPYRPARHIPNMQRAHPKKRIH